ncbi:MAG: hypothetical protein IH625_15785 [Rhodobacteraceae bacterium]|nr:hypothetical protein [Paracoccaceae bacterium]
MTDKTPIAAMARMAGQMTAAAAAGQAVGLNVLLAEMQALAGVMPGVMTLPDPAQGAPDEAEERRQQAETEANFDNMPV